MFSILEGNFTMHELASEHLVSAGLKYLSNGFSINIRETRIGIYFLMFDLKLHLCVTNRSESECLRLTRTHQLGVLGEVTFLLEYSDIIFGFQN